jgi:hypothetical protein
MRIGVFRSGRWKWPKEVCFDLVKKIIDNLITEPKLTKADFLKKRITALRGRPINFAQVYWAIYVL